MIFLSDWNHPFGEIVERKTFFTSKNQIIYTSTSFNVNLFRRFQGFFERILLIPHREPKEMARKKEKSVLELDQITLLFKGFRNPYR